MEIDWQNVRKILIVRLRSIGDTVLSTPSLINLRKFLPDAQIDVLLEDWVAPILDDFEAVDNILTVSKDTKDRIKLAKELRNEKYDVAFNLHGGTTSTFLIRASGAKHRVGYKNYQYSFLYNHLLNSASDFWEKEKTHSAEQQMALLGFAGIDVDLKSKTRLVVPKEDKDEIDLFLHVHGIEDDEKIALIHPAAAFESKRWSAEKFAEIIVYLSTHDLTSVVLTSPNEKRICDDIRNRTSTFFHGFWDLDLRQVKALAKRAEVFVGNDSGIAHISAALETPTVVIFGSSNRDHWRPWTDSPSEIVYKELSCQPCAGRICEEFEKPRCILEVSVKKVQKAVERVLSDRI